MARLRRRDFFGILAIALPLRLNAQIAVEFARPRNPYEGLFRAIEPGHDEFPFEKTVAEIVAHLKRKYPAGRFFVLPDNRIRYEIASPNTYRVGHWRYRWTGTELSGLEQLGESIATSAAPLFLDVTSAAVGHLDSFQRQLLPGIPHWRTHLDAATGIDVHGHNGIAVGDIDGSGFDALYICQPGGLPNRLYRNRGDGMFEDITEQSSTGILDNTSSALFADFRNVGRQDLVVLRPDGPLYFLNNGELTFTLKPGAFRFRTVPQGSFTSMAAADYDRDGKLDLYLCSYTFFRDGSQYRYPSPYEDARNGPPNFLFRNEMQPDGSGSFIDATAVAGLNENNDRFSLACAWCEGNLYVANDFGRNNFYLYENGRFRDVAAEAGVEDVGAGMAASWFDYDGDGQPDLYVSNMWSDAGQRVIEAAKLEPRDLWRRHAKGNSLYRNLGNGKFEETGVREGVEMGRWAWSSAGIDFDNDGTPEIFVTCGMLTNDSTTDLESFFWRKVAAKRSGPDYENGWNALSQAAHGAYSEAGRQPNVFHVRKDGRYQDYSGVSGLDVAEDSRAFAATDIDGDGRVDLVLKSRLGPQVRVFRNNCAESRTSLAIRLTGVRTNRDAIGAKVTVDGRAQWVEAGSGYISQHTKVLNFGLGDKGTAEMIRIQWPSGLEQEFHHLQAGFRYDITEGDEKPRSNPFQMRQDVPAPPVQANNFATFADTWLMEPLLLPEAQKGPGVLHLPATLTGQRAALYGVFFRYIFDLRSDLPLPVWFILDSQGRARKICFREPDPAEVAKAAAPFPFPGRYITKPSRNFAAFGAAFHAAGLPEHALRYLELAPQDNAAVLLAIGKIHLGAGRWRNARNVLQRSVELAPDSAEGWNALGAADVGESDIRRALERFEKALLLKPDLPQALVNAGQAHGALGHFDQAESLLKRAFEIAPDSVAAANQLGELYASKGRDAEAKPWFQRAIAARRDYAPAINNLGALYRRTGQTGDAIAAFRHGIQAAPDDEAAYLNLASLQVALGDRDAARLTVQALLARNPQSTMARAALRELE